MDIFDSPDFRLNKKLLRVIELWPYDSQRKIIRVCWIVVVLAMTVPHVTAAIVDISDVDKTMEHLCILMIVSQVFLKYVTLAFAENEMKSVYNDIANNYVTIVDEDEKIILLKYSKRGRLLTIIYMAMLMITGAAFMIMPLVPEVLNAIDPLPIPRPHLFILNGEFLVDKDDHFYKIYMWDTASVFVVVTLFVAIDSMYTVTVEQGTALYAIITYRLSKLRHHLRSDLQGGTDSSYEWLLHTIKLHQTVLNFTSNISDSYSACFFCLSIMNIVHLPITCVVVLVHLHNFMYLVRYALALICLLVHVLVLFWPGQKLIDHSTSLLEDAYCNEWYQTPAKTKRLLRIFMLRCSKPCEMLAGGLVVMNFEVYLKIVKTAASYITVLASYR